MLSTSPVMRLLLPWYAVGPVVEPEDRVIHEIEVLVNGRYETATDSTSDEGQLAFQTAVGMVDGEAVAGARFWLDAARTAYITISEVQVDPGNPTGYQFDHVWLGQEGARPTICAPDEDGDHWAYVVGGVHVDVEDATVGWDPGALLIACASGAVGKSIMWGAHPWQGSLFGTDVDITRYQAGVRAVRADYEGNGVSYTTDGVLIQIHFPLGGRYFVDDSQPTEAVFGPDGALCLSNPRVPGQGAYLGIPPCGTNEEIELMIASSFGAPFIWTKLAVPPEEPEEPVARAR